MAGLGVRCSLERTSDASKLAEGVVVRRVAGWMSRANRLDALQLQWQRMETSLFARAVAQGKDCARVVAGKSAEARAMRELAAEIDTGLESLIKEAGDILSIKSATPVEALAKIELGLRAQGPYDWREHAYELISGGIDELKAVLNASRR